MLVKFAVWSMTRLIAILRSALLAPNSRGAGKEETAAAEIAEATNCLREISFVLDMRSSQATVAETQLIQIFETRASPRSSSKRKSAVILQDRKSTRLNSSHQIISYAVFCLKKKKKKKPKMYAQAIKKSLYNRNESCNA